MEVIYEQLFNPEGLVDISEVGLLCKMTEYLELKLEHKDMLRRVVSLYLILVFKDAFYDLPSHVYVRFIKD